MKSTMKHQTVSPVALGIFPDAEELLPEGIPEVAWVRCPWQEELDNLMKQYNFDMPELMALQLHYELLGGGCVSATYFDPDIQQPRIFRLLEWNIPEEVMATSVWEDCGPFYSRSIPGYVGVVSGITKVDRVFTAINMSPEAVDTPINIDGIPVSWVLRRVMEDNTDFRGVVSGLLKSGPVVRQAWLMVAAPSYGTTVIMMEPDGRHETVIEAPSGYSVHLGNSYEVDDRQEAVYEFMGKISEQLDTKSFMEIPVSTLPEVLQTGEFFTSDCYALVP